MFDNLIMHLKNIIFFKVTTYLILTIALFVLMPRFSKDLESNVIKNEKAYKLLQTTRQRVQIIDDFHESISKVRLEYKNLIEKTQTQGCLDRGALVKEIAKLNEKYSLFEPIFVRIYRNFDYDEISNSPNIRVDNYDMKLAFRCKDYETILMLSKDLYSLLPVGSVVINTKIQQRDGLDPDDISKLNTKRSPGLLQVSMNILLREVVYEKK